jgi:hypothetical protein
VGLVSTAGADDDDDKDDDDDHHDHDDHDHDDDDDDDDDDDIDIEGQPGNLCVQCVPSPAHLSLEQRFSQEHRGSMEGRVCVCVARASGFSCRCSWQLAAGRLVPERP